MILAVEITFVCLWVLQASFATDITHCLPKDRPVVHVESSLASFTVL